MKPTSVIVISVTAAIIGSFPSWTQKLILSFIHIFSCYLLPLLQTIRAIHLHEYESFHSVHLTYFILLFAVIEPCFSITHRFHSSPVLLQLSLDSFILWLLLPKSQGIRYVHDLFLSLIRSSMWLRLEESLPYEIYRRFVDFVSSEIYQRLLQYLISYAVRHYDATKSSKNQSSEAPMDSKYDIIVEVEPNDKKTITMPPSPSSPKRLNGIPVILM